MSTEPTAAPDLDAAARKITFVRDTLRMFASNYVLDALADAIRLVETHACPVLSATFVVGDEVTVVNDLEHLPVGTMFTDACSTQREAMLTAGKCPDRIPRQLTWSDGMSVNIGVIPPEVFPLTIKYLPEVTR